MMRAMKTKATALNLAGLVEVQPGAVVSKTIIDKKVGTVTIFGFDENQGLSEHTAPYDAMVQVLDGEVEITVAGQPNRVKQGEFIILPANKPHALKGVTAFKMLLIMIRA
jgi:quercetin dioxygenase-like cupin family protein